MDRHLFKRFANLCGIILLILGILGFIPPFVDHGLLFKFYKVNAPLNVIYLLTGLIGVIVAQKEKFYIRLYFQIIGFVYSILAILGFIYGDAMMLGIIANNLFVASFHLIIGILALIIGFGTKEITKDKRFK
jgi:hypothetical protein